jgi:hypothetical protein
MTRDQPAHYFLLGNDYHLGDLLWFTAVLREYQRQRRPDRLVVALPDRATSRILEGNPLINELIYGEMTPSWRRPEGLCAGSPPWTKQDVVYDLRPVPIALTMMRQWRRLLPWLYYRDLWLQERGQWLATFLGLGQLRDYRPELRLDEGDRVLARRLPPRYVVMAPHVGVYALPLLGALWSRIKGRSDEYWIRLADAARQEGYEPITLSAAGQPPIPDTTTLAGLPIRQVAGVIERAAALVTVESGLWFIAAALGTPFIITPWWLPRSVDWAAPMQTPHLLLYRPDDSTEAVLSYLRKTNIHETA